MVLQTEHTKQPDMQGTFLLSHLLIGVAFELDTSCSFINASCVISLDREVECHAPDPGPTRLADPNRSPGRKTIYTISIYCTVLY